MSVRELNGKFKGLRVQRTINKKSYQKHFSFRIPLRRNGVTAWRDATAEERRSIIAKAEAYDRKLEIKQEAETEKRVFDPFGSNTNTNIKGIAYRVGKDSQGYDVEAFWLNVSDNGKQHSSSVRLANRSWTDGWKMIVDKLIKVKGLDAATHKKVLAAIPSEKKLRGTVKKEKRK